jgi:hypothetical protein
MNRSDSAVPISCEEHRTQAQCGEGISFGVFVLDCPLSIQLVQLQLQKSTRLEETTRKKGKEGVTFLPSNSFDEGKRERNINFAT